MLNGQRTPTSEDKTIEPNVTKKTTGFSNKMQKILRAFRKDNLSQSTQQLVLEECINKSQTNDKISSAENQSTDEEKKDINDSEINFNKKKKVKKKRKLVRTPALNTSDWSSENDIGSTANLVEERIEEHEIEEITASYKQNDVELLNSTKNQYLRRSELVSLGDHKSKLMDVVADVHQESINNNINTNNNSDSSNNSKNNRRALKKKDIIEGAIYSEDEAEQQFTSNIHNHSTDLQKISSAESGRKQRKRWSTDNSAISLPRKESSPSSSISDGINNSWVKNKKPIPVPKRTKILNKIENNQNKNHGIDNHAFQSEEDNIEQVLRIETEYGPIQKTTRIEMKSAESDSGEIPNRHQKILEDAKIPEHSDTLNKLTEKDRKKDINNLKRRKNIHTDSNTIRDNMKNRTNDFPARQNRKKNNNKFVKEDTTEDSTSSTVDPQRANEIENNEIPSTKKTRKPKDRKKKSASLSENASSLELSHSNKAENKIKKKRAKKQLDKTRSMKFVSITIFKADMLEPDFMTRHPMVITHIVEESSGDYLKIPTHSETKSSYLQPLITNTFDFKEHQTMTPYWDEELIFEYDFQSIIDSVEDKRILILFEIVDLPSFADASNAYDHFGSTSCWYKIAWAFLKPIGANGTLHINKLLRLQLYKPKRNMKRMMKQKCDPYSWWKLGYRDKYPSTLYVTIRSVDPPQLEPVFYDQLLLNELSDEHLRSTKTMTTSNGINICTPWSRLTSQSCKIPNELYFKTELSENGCFFVAFSNNGKYLACTNCEEYDYPIVIYKIDEEKVYIKLAGHKSFIYSLDWAVNDNLLLSVSSDQTAKIWDVENQMMYELNMLPHPSYVYCGKFNPKNSRVIITGCYDRIPRIWSCKKKSQTYELFQELEGHTGFINSICFTKEDDILTADSVGVIIQWNLKKRKGRLSKDWQIARKIKLKEIDDVVINSIILHPSGSRLVVHTRDSQLRMIELASGATIQRYQGLHNSRIQIAAQISPCGNLLFCGSEDAILYVWNVESGKCIATYQLNLSNVAVTSVDYHPYDHIIAFCVFGCEIETQILRYHKKSSGESVGLKLIDSMYNKRINSGRNKSLNSILSYDSDIPRRSSDGSGRSANNDDIVDEILQVSRDDIRIRLKLFNESENKVKTRTINRLSNIIAKIDKMLLNNSSGPRATYDIEANREIDRLNLVRSPDNKSSGYYEEPPDISSFASAASERSTTTIQSEMLEMASVSKDKQQTRKRMKKRQNSPSKKQLNIDTYLIKPVSEDIREQTQKNMTKDTTNLHDQVLKVKENSKRWCGSSEDSGGTYTISNKNHKSEGSDDTRVSSGSSVRSDVTFIIEREKPVPKPRKKI